MGMREKFKSIRVILQKSRICGETAKIYVKLPEGVCAKVILLRDLHKT
jgi:hypothetical protein